MITVNNIFHNQYDISSSSLFPMLGCILLVTALLTNGMGYQMKLSPQPHLIILDYLIIIILTLCIMYSLLVLCFVLL